MKRFSSLTILIVVGFSSAFGVAMITRNPLTTSRTTGPHADGIITGCDSVGDACILGCKSGDHGSYWSIVPSGMLPCTPGWFGNACASTPCDTRTYSMPNCPPSDYQGDIEMDENACPSSTGPNPPG